MKCSATGLALRGLALTSALLLSTAAFAAPDAKKTADDFVAALTAKGGAKASFESAEADGDNVVITNLQVSSPEEGEVSVPSVVIENPQPREAGGFSAASIAFDNGSMVDQDTKFTWTTGITKDAIIPAPKEMKSTAKLTPFSHFEVTELSVSDSESPEPVTVGSVTLDLTNIVDGAPNDGALKISEIYIPGAVLNRDEQAKETMEQLGYDSLTLNVAVDGGYDGAKQTLDFRAITIEGEGVGKLAVNGVFGGLPREKLQNPDQIQELAATATVNSLTLRFDNAGVVEKLLDMQAKTSGSSREQFVDEITGALPLLLNVIGNQGFQDKVAAAATAFLKAPKSLSVAAKPAAPVSVMQVFGAATTAPQTLPDILAVEVDANK